MSASRTLQVVAAIPSLLMLYALFATEKEAWAQTFQSVVVPGTAVIFDPDGTLSASELTALSGNFTGGNLVATEAVKAMTFAPAPGQTLTMSASGAIDCCGGTPHTGPAGYLPDVNISPLKSISGYSGPGFALVGVFTNGAISGTAPETISYSGGTDIVPSSISLNQVFYIGNGGTSSGSPLVFPVPKDATELWLGIADTYVNGNGPPGGYGDNTGQFVASGTLSSDCSLTSAIDPSEIGVWNSTEISAFIVKGNDKHGNIIDYVRFTPGNVIGQYEIPPYGISINANSAFRVTAPSGDAPGLAMAQNLIDWHGWATYGTGSKAMKEYFATPGYPFDSSSQPPYHIMDPIGLIGPIWYKGVQNQTIFNDSPEINIPRYDDRGEQLTSIHYIKSFITYVGCSYLTSKTRLIAAFRPQATVSWSTVYEGDVSILSRLRSPIHPVVIFAPDDPNFSGVPHPAPASAFKSGMTLPQLNPPVATCFTSYRDFDGQILPIAKCPTAGGGTQ